MAASTIVTASAEEAGEVTLEIDETTYAFPLWKSQSDWSGSESYTSVNIFARPGDKQTKAKFQTFTLGFETMGSNLNSGEITLTRLVDGDRQKLYAGTDEDEGGIDLVLESKSVDGDELKIAGTFTTQMGTSKNYGRDVDLSNPVEVSGRFDVTLGPVE